jgi:hypothetical protein
MPDDLVNSIRRFAVHYDRGIITPHEFALQILDLLVAGDPSPEEIAQAFAEVPHAMMPTMKSELHEFADADFYRRTFGIGDSRTEAQVHADALARQAPLRRICAILIPLVMVRNRHDSQ